MAVADVDIASGDIHNGRPEVLPQDLDAVLGVVLLETIEVCLNLVVARATASEAEIACPAGLLAGKARVLIGARERDPLATVLLEN